MTKLRDKVGQAVYLKGYERLRLGVTLLGHSLTSRSWATGVGVAQDGVGAQAESTLMIGCLKGRGVAKSRVQPEWRVWGRSLEGLLGSTLKKGGKD